MFAAYVTCPVELIGATTFFCVPSVILRFAEKLVNAESICDVLEESLFTVFDSSIPLNEYAIAVFENVSSLVDNLNTS